MTIISSSLNFSFPVASFGSIVFPVMISKTLFLERIRFIPTFQALKFDAPSSLFSYFMEEAIGANIQGGI